MKIAKTTKAKIDAIKMDSLTAKQQLEMCVTRLNEHSGTKRIAVKLTRVIDKLDDWLKVA